MLERLITHLSAGALHVCGLGGLLLIGLPYVGGWTMVVVEGVEGTGVAGTLEVMEGVEVLVLVFGSLVLSTMVSTCIHLPITPLSLSTHSAI